MYTSIVMSKSIDIDKAGECLRNILDNNRCSLCDKWGSVYLRCAYGHLACNDCSVKEDGCLTCFTTFNSPVLNNTWRIDKLHTEKSKNALELLKVFEDTFKTDVYKRQRISDQLKAEKELFPDCIQAPMKYINKRKSLKPYSAISNKENSQQSYYPGEDIFPLKATKMEKSKYVQQWLEGKVEKSSSRKPFANINVNRVSSVHKSYVKTKSSIDKNNTLRKKKMSTNKKANMSRYPNKNKSSPEKSFFNMVKNIENIEKPNIIRDDKNKGNKQDDSGIVIDEESIIIEDTPTKIIDKDQLALQAVHEAEKNEYSDKNSIHEETQDNIKKNKIVKVPYTKKSLLYVSCPNCNLCTEKHDSIQGNTNEISITIEYGSTVQANVNRQSISVQTDISEINEINRNLVTANIVINKDAKQKLLSPQKYTSWDQEVQGSQDLFKDDLNILKQNEISEKFDWKVCDVSSKNKENALIIDESDTDVEPEHVQVAAEVHRTCEPKDYDILSELKLNEMLNRKRPAKRGMTPGSTDSSEKENFDPNRTKRTKFAKKGKKKLNK